MIKADQCRDGETRAVPPLRGGLRRFVPVGVVVLAMAAIFASGLHRHVSLETLVQHRMAIDAFVAAHCVAAFGLGMAEAAPDAALVYGGYWDGARIDGGRVKIPDAPGAGFEAKANLFAVLETI